MRADTAGTNGNATALAEDPYRAVAEHLPDVVVLVFDRELRFRMVTGGTLVDTTSLADEFVGRTVFDVLPPEQAATLAAWYRAALAGDRQHFETPGWRDPSRFWSVDVVPMRDRHGVVDGGMAYCCDVTARHQAERALREHRRQLVEAQHVARVGSFEVDLVSGRQTGSTEMYRIFGLDPGAELTVGAALALLHPDDRPAAEALVARAVDDPSPYELECRVVRPDGTVRTLLCRGEGLRDASGRVVRLVGTNQDVTAAKQAEQERRGLLTRLYGALEGQHQRLAGDLHDSHLQSLTAIALKLDQAVLRVDRGDQARSRDLLGSLRTDVRDEIVALRRTVAALRPLVLDQRGLAAAVRELAAATGARAGLDACDVTVDPDGGPLDPAVETALFRVAQQALANIERHAGARHVGVGLERAGGTVVLRVVDDGRGFDPTRRESASDAHGFGLISMRERVEAIGGDLTVRAAPGAGTSVEARVPAEPPS
jgi:PAS domain S-box-containing protein